MKKDVSTAGCVLAILYLPILLFVGALAHGLAVSILWGWFIVPIFHLPALTIPQALGVGLVAGLLTKEFDEHESKDDSDSLGETLLKGTIKVLMRPAFALLFGLVVLKFI